MIRQAFSRAAAKPEGSSGNDFLEAILRERTDLKDQTAYFPGNGADADGHKQGNFGHTVFIGAEVFKGPNTAMQAPQFDEEYKVMQQMEGKGLPVPRVTCVGKETFFFGMTRMPGVTLEAYEDTDGLTTDETKTLARDLADFVVGMAEAFPLRPHGGFMAHRDLHAGNILIDTESRKLTAVIDFGRTGYSLEPIVFLEGDLKKFFDGEYTSRTAEAPNAPVKKDTGPIFNS